MFRTRRHEKHPTGQHRPIPLRSAPQNVGTILIRFVGLLIVAIVVLATMWLR
jgi:hypothetical protein